MKTLSTFANRLKMVSGYFAPALEGRAFPQEVNIELTNHCNLACVMCPHKTMTRKKGFMDEKIFKAIIDEISGKSELVYLYGTGESLLHKQVYDYAAYAKSRGLATCLSTNGQLMGEEDSRRLLTCGVDYLIIALDGGVKETYESIRVKGDFDRLVANIKTLLRLKADIPTSTKLCLQMIYMEKNAHETELFHNLFTPEERKQVDQFRFKPLYETYALEQKPVRHTRPCYWLWNMMAIYWNGDATICCMDADAEYVLGNVAREGVESVWNGKGMNGLRKAHRKLEYDGMKLCGTCDIPQQGYFTPLNILGSVLLSASQVRDILPLYEKYVLLPMKKYKNKK